MAPTEEVYVSPWHKGVLIPFWVLQLLLIVTAIGISGAGLTVFGQALIYLDYSAGDNFAVATWSTTIAFCLVSKAFIIAEIILFPQQRLREVIYFAFQVTKMSLWTCLMIAQIVNCLLPFSIVGGYFWASFAINLIIWALFLGTLIYGSIIFHRFRVRNKPIRNNAEPIYVINQPQQPIQIPNRQNPISPAYLAALNQLGALNHPDPQGFANSARYPSIHITYNYGPTQSQPVPQQGHILEEFHQNQPPEDIDTSRQNTNPGSQGTVPARRPVASNTSYGSGTIPIQSYEPPEIDHNRAPSVTSRGGPPSYVSHV